MGNVVEWALRLKTQTFVAPAQEVVATVKKLTSAADVAAPAVTKLGNELSSVEADARKAASGIADVSREAADAAKSVTRLADAHGRLRSGVGTLAGADGGLAARLAALEPLRAAARASAAATETERRINSTVPTALMQAPPRLSAFARAVQFTGRTFGGGAARGLMRFGDALARLEEVATVAGPAVLAVGGAAAVAGAGAVFAAGKFVTTVAQAQALKEDLSGALKILLKSQNAADDALRVAIKTADFVGVSRSATAGQFVDLLAKGFDVKKVDTIVRSLADLSTVDPKADLERLTRTIGQIAATGRLQGDELNELANAGLETGAVYDALAKQLGKTRTEVMKLKEAGKITSDQAIDAILGAINAQAGGGEAGAAAGKKSLESLSKLFKRLAVAPENALFSLEVGPQIDILKGALREVTALFDVNTDSGKLFAATLTDVFGALVEGFFGVDPTKAGGDIKATFTDIAQGIRDAKPEIRAFAENLRKLVDFGGDVLAFAGKVSQLKASVSGFIEGLGPVGTVIKFAFWPVTLAANGVWYLMDAIAYVSEFGIDGLFYAIGESVVTFASDIVASATELGSNIIDGLTAGITGKTSAVIGAISGVVSGAIAEAKNLLGIASPSKVFAEIGQFTVQGFERGVASNDTGAIEEMLAPPDLSAIVAGGERAGAAMAGGGGGPITVNVNVDARGATASDAQRIAEMVDERLVRTLETLGLSIGAAA